jgi:pimeloyl-ACP methyl ester carboxylesterase
MRTYRPFSKLLALLFIAPAIIVSCTREATAPVYKNFVSKEVALQLKKEYLSGLIDLVSESNPEALAIKPLVGNDVTVYKIVYKTTVNNQEIDASGLVCVPAAQGSYPVLSFQNGTNTLNASAPSELPSDYSYQMVELIASLGYIVTVADYPGFGASVSLPHPYLIKEPTVRSLVDMLYAVKEMVPGELKGISLINNYFLLGYSQGGWATLALHKALELDYSSDFDLKGSACGAGPYDIYLLMQGMIAAATYPMPVYIGYIVNAYSEYNQFTNPVTDILNQPYASRISTLYTGQLTSTEINNQLTTSIADLINPDFLAGFASAAQYSSIRVALADNSISGWHSYKPLFLVHGASDTTVDPVSTENMYGEMIQAGTPADICTKVIIPGADHGSGLIPSMVQGILFLDNLKNSR